MGSATRVDRFELEEAVFRGPKATVWKAHDPASARTVALKLFTAAVSGQAAARFDREVAAAARLRHPHLVCVFDAGRVDGRPYYAMEWISGGTLQGEIDRRGARLGTEEVLAWGVQLASALAALHAAGLIHRDVKPANVLIDSHRHARLADLGLVKDLRADAPRLTLSHTPHGSPGYWSPEQAGCELDALTPATDVYGLGATLFAAFAGRPPIEADTLTGHLAHALAGNTDSLAELRPDLDPRIVEVISRCLDPAPARRFADGAALEAALRRVQAPPAPARSLPLYAGAALVAAAASVAGLLLLLPGRPSPPRGPAAPARGAAPARSTPAPAPGAWRWPAPGSTWRWTLRTRISTPVGGDYRWSWRLDLTLRERTATGAAVCDGRVLRAEFVAVDPSGTILEAYDSGSGEPVRGGTSAHLKQIHGGEFVLTVDPEGACSIEGLEVSRIPRVRNAPMHGYDLTRRTFSAAGLARALGQHLRLPDPAGTRQGDAALWVMNYPYACVVRGDRTPDGPQWTGRIQALGGNPPPSVRGSLSPLLGAKLRGSARGDARGLRTARLSAHTADSAFESDLERDD